MSVEKKARVVTVASHFINNGDVAPVGGKHMDVLNPSNNVVCGSVAVGCAKDVDVAAKAANAAFKEWSALTVRKRCECLITLYGLIKKHEDAIADIIVLEHGKTKSEALGSVRKGNETVAWAMGMPGLIQGKVLEVSRGVECKEYRIPHGVVACIVPFNFPAMVPMWTVPIALACGNTVILKPSEKVPLTMHYMAKLFAEAGFPKGVFNIVHGTKDVVEALCDHDLVKAVTFVGSSFVAELVAKRCRQLNKRVLALGGAKNHLVAVPDCNIEMTSQDIVNSYTGCSGQRCMAASVLLLVGNQKELLEKVVEKSRALKLGQGNRDVGPIIDQGSLNRIRSYIDKAEKDGETILLDGRTWSPPNSELKDGNWIGPTVILHKNVKHPAMTDEIFGPVISVYQCKSNDEAIAIENGNPYGNAACIYTSSGGTANWFSQRFSAGMIGVNVGVPVPREPFSFGGINRSKFGDFDVTADGCVEFMTMRKKVTSKWAPPKEWSWMS